jgi:polyphenol oxidase
LSSNKRPPQPSPCQTPPLYAIAHIMQRIFCKREVTHGLDGGPCAVAARLAGLLPGSRIVCLEQIHSDRIVRAEDIAPGVFPEADAVISLDPTKVLCIRTADCVPLLLWAEDSPIIAAVHAGWKGLAQRIVSKTIGLMRAEGAHCIHVSMGPSIGPCCYAVGADVIDALETVPDRCIGGGLYVDLHRISSLQARDAGVSPEMIHQVQACTYCNSDSFFSYRREGEHAGRNISLIGGEACSLPGLQAL